MITEPFWIKPKTVKLKNGSKIILRPSTKTDLEPTWDMFRSFSDETLQYLPDPIDRERVEGWFKEIDYTKALPILGIVKQKSGYKVITSATLQFSQGIYSHKARFGISIHDDMQNKGLGQILTEYMLDIARERGMKKVELSVVSHNHRAIHIYEKMGFEKEGFTKMDHWNPTLEAYGDSYHMGLLLT